MRKTFKKIIQVICVVLIVVSLSITAVGYSEYKKVTAETPISEKVLEIQKSDAYVEFNDIAPLFVKAVIATEDARFPYRKSPLDFIAITRAMRMNLRSHHFLEGGSTIPQQLAKNMYFDHSASLTRKVSEYFISRKITKEYNKEEIFALYASIIYFGDGYYGIESASQGYFSVSSSELSPFQSTLLAGIPQAPSVYQLSTNYEGARKRQKHVLKRMVHEKYLSQEEAEFIYQDDGGISNEKTTNDQWN